jgi:integrase
MASATKAKRRTRTKAPGVYRSVSGRYEIAYRGSDGRLRSKAIGDSFEEAKAARAEIVSKLSRGESVRHSKQTFEAFAEDVIDALNRRPRTVESHRYHLRSHLIPRFGRRKLGDITTADLARMVADMERKEYAGWTIIGTLSTMSLVMRKAKRQGLVAANPLHDLERDERPSASKTDKRVLEQAEIEALLKTAGDRYQPLIALMLFTGLRLGEALGLTWRDVDFDGERIQVRYQLGRDRKRVEAKTAAGRRDVVMIPQLAKVLREHKLRSPYSRDVDYVFPAPDGSGREHRSTSRGIERAVERAKLGEGISPHNFRHTFASLLIVGLRLDPVRVARQLGHTNPSFTQDTYAHLFEQARHAAALRDELEQGFGHLLNGVNGMSTSAGNQAQDEPGEVGAIAASSG